MKQTITNVVLVGVTFQPNATFSKPTKIWIIYDVILSLWRLPQRHSRREKYLLQQHTNSHDICMLCVSVFPLIDVRESQSVRRGWADDEMAKRSLTLRWGFLSSSQARSFTFACFAPGFLRGAAAVFGNPERFYLRLPPVTGFVGVARWSARRFFSITFYNPSYSNPNEPIHSRVVA